MRKVFWIVIIVFWLAVIGAFAYFFLHTPKKDIYDVGQSFVSIGTDYVEGRDIDLTKIRGSDNNAEYLKILGTLFQTLSSTQRELGKQTSLINVLVQPRNLSSTQSLDVSLQRADDYAKLIAADYTKTEAAYQQASADMLKVDRKNLRFDSVGLVDSIKSQQPYRQKEYQYYSGLAQYIKATIQFAKSRTGYIHLSDDGNTLNFTRPADQQYYNQLVSGIASYTKQIDQDNEKDIYVVKAQVGRIKTMLSHVKK